MTITPQGGGVDDTPYIQTAIDALTDGGIVQLSPGEFKIGITPHTSYGTVNAASQYGLFIPSNVHLRGEGKGATVLTKHASSVPQHMVAFLSAQRASVSHMTIDGGWTSGSGGGRGITSDVLDYPTDLTSIEINDVEVCNHAGYGIGLQIGTFKRCGLRNIWVHDVGADGIDVKNRLSDVEDNWMTDVLVERFGLTLSGQAGLDIRGRWILNNIRVRDFGGQQTDTTGVRFRGSGPSGEEFSLHSLKSVLTGFDIESIDNGSSIGLHIQGERNIASSGLVSGCNLGVLFSPTSGYTCYRNMLSNVNAYNNRTKDIQVNSGTSEARIFRCLGTVLDNGTSTVVN